jgi:hypothetical protein
MTINLKDFYSGVHRSAIYGNTSVSKWPFVAAIIKTIGAKRILDYGCGQSRLFELLNRKLGVSTQRYDPSVEGIDSKPQASFDLLINIDVLEHIPEEQLDAVFDEFRKLSNRHFIIIDTKPARLFLPDGRNAHLTLYGKDWWAKRLGLAFPTVKAVDVKTRSRVAFITFEMKFGQKLVFKILLIAFRIWRLFEKLRHNLRALNCGNPD